MTIWHCTSALVRSVAAVHHLVQIGISQNHASRGSLPPSPITGSMIANACDRLLSSWTPVDRKRGRTFGMVRWIWRVVSGGEISGGAVGG